jgi:hypothetical protein
VEQMRFGEQQRVGLVRTIGSRLPMRGAGCMATFTRSRCPGLPVRGLHRRCQGRREGRPLFSERIEARVVVRDDDLVAVSASRAPYPLRRRATAVSSWQRRCANSLKLFADADSNPGALCGAGVVHDERWLRLLRRDGGARFHPRSRQELSFTSRPLDAGRRSGPKDRRREAWRGRPPCVLLPLVRASPPALPYPSSPNLDSSS